MENKIIIGLVGQIASGKGTVAEYLEKNHQATTFRFSTILRDVLNRLHVDISRENLQDLSTILRQKFGEDLLAKVMAGDVEKTDNKIVVVDGIRRMADIKYLKELENFKLLSVVADPKVRYQRLIERSENSGDSQKTYEDFLADQMKEADAEIPEVMKNADVEINNDIDFENLYQQIDKLLN
ncbi:AAA family ATPase [Candidatus Parcubacteria bacterium]|nr:AAA family ATPase [Patescibacteria group bacterium]MBU4309162.1 AAA family ATPase [Patescibacteria group bacterium]MBU4432685.1 AAA family ATPase [Patescibacteria group bacterium]MBU4577523.1 AAA family ATPase [Patescibacteria group bacterium]MCG2697210.1 AAA family ATPase [Candidatus Parcubacteria bacterium]